MTWRAAMFTLGCVTAAAAAIPPDGQIFATALTLYHERQFSTARSCFEAAAKLDPRNTDIDFYLARIALWFNREVEAATRLELAAARNPDDARIQNALGDLYGLRAQTAAVLVKPVWACKCRAAYERAIALEPENVRFRWSLLGFDLLAPRIVGGGFDRAREQADAIARIDDMQGRIARATIALKRGDPDAAFAEFDPVLRRDPDNFLALYHVGRCAALSGRHLERGLAALRRAEAVPRGSEPEQPTAANIHQRIGDILAQMGDNAGAAAEYRLVHFLEPDFRAEKLILRY